MARLLREEGRQVECLVLLDPLLPRFERQASAFPHETIEDIATDESGSVTSSRSDSSWQRFLKTPLLGKTRWVWQRRDGFRRYTLRTSARILRALYRKGLWPNPKVPLLLRAEWALLCKEAIWTDYRPEPYDGDMILFAGAGRIEAEKTAARTRVTSRRCIIRLHFGKACVALEWPQVTISVSSD